MVEHKITFDSNRVQWIMSGNIDTEIQSRLGANESMRRNIHKKLKIDLSKLRHIVCDEEAYMWMHPDEGVIFNIDLIADKPADANIVDIVGRRHVHTLPMAVMQLRDVLNKIYAFFDVEFVFKTNVPILVRL